MTRAEMMSAMRNSGGDGADFLTAAAAAGVAVGAVFRWIGMTRAEMMSAMRSSGGDGADFLTEAISK
jgi:hypothetical protein